MKVKLDKSTGSLKVNRNRYLPKSIMLLWLIVLRPDTNYISIWRRHYYLLRDAKFRSTLGTYRLWLWWCLFQATRAVTWAYGACGLIRRTYPIQSPLILRQNKVYWEPILTRNPKVQSSSRWVNAEIMKNTCTTWILWKMV